MGTEPAAPTGEPAPREPWGRRAPGGRPRPRAVKGLAEARSKCVLETESCVTWAAPDSGSDCRGCENQPLQGWPVRRRPHPHCRGVRHLVCSPPLWGHSLPPPASLAARFFPLGSLKPASSWSCPLSPTGHPLPLAAPQQLRDGDPSPPARPSTSQSEPAWAGGREAEYLVLCFGDVLWLGKILFPVRFLRTSGGERGQGGKPLSLKA